MLGTVEVINILKVGRESYKNSCSERKGIGKECVILLLSTTLSIRVRKSEHLHRLYVANVMSAPVPRFFPRSVSKFFLPTPLSLLPF